MKRWCLLGVLLGSLLPQAEAHPLAPALLELRELDAGRYAVLWRTSVARVQGTDVQPRLPPQCRPTTSMGLSAEENQSQVLRWQVDCGVQGLSGHRLAVSGLERSGINVILRVEPLRGAVLTQLLDAGTPALVVPEQRAQPAVFPAYLRLGVEHLLLGWDHVLFVIGLVLLVRRLRPLVFTITAFTLGHSVTLALATLGLVHLDQRVTELAIAGSILYLAVELLRPAGPPTLMRRKPWLMAALFGLLHGLGFAGALTGVGLPAGEIPLALFAFNLGIEAGQLLLIAGLLLVGAFGDRFRSVPAGTNLNLSPARTVALAPAYVIGSLAAFWCFERAALLV